MKSLNLSIILWISVLSAFFLLNVPGYAAERAERYYYSIHIDALNKLEDAKRQVASLRSRGLKAFWMMTERPGESDRYKVYVGLYDSGDQAVDSWKKLKRLREVKHFSIHLLRKSAIPLADLGIGTLRTDRTYGAFPRRERGRFIDNGDGTVTDQITNLMWVKNGWRSEFKDATTWWDAIKRTRRLKLAGHDDWRLPTIDEWLTILDPNQQFPALVEPNPFRNMITHVPYWSNTEYSYGLDFSCNTVCPLEAYAVMLYSGNVNHQNKSDRGLVMAVRSLN